MFFCSTKADVSLNTSALQWPWILLNISLYAFAIPWMLSAIIDQYFISKDYDETLPGLDNTWARKFFISAHMGLGLICLLLYPLQLLQCIRKRLPVFHRWSGRISLLAAAFTSVCGIVFICLKKFHLVGGINMGIAFFVYGLVFGTCAFMTGYFARKREFQRHKNWAIRSYSQILATMLYRYFYTVLGGFGAVHSPAEDEWIDCDQMDVCDYFLKPFDVIHVWTFFIVPLLFAEAVIHVSRDKSKDRHVVNIDVSSNDNKGDCNNEEGTIQELPDAVDSNTTEADNVCSNRNVMKNETSTLGEVHGATSYFYLNLLGIFSAMICLGTTVFIYVTSALGVNTFAV